MIPVNEIFPTIQGEGHFAGTPSVFIRLQGCPVGCPWCDTKHTWPEGNERKRVDLDTMLHKTEDAPTWAGCSEDEIVAAVLELGQRHFVITGGEPAMHDLHALTVALGAYGKVQLETSGTYPVIVSMDTWVTVSPKVLMPGGLAVRRDAIHRANEIKMPVANASDIEKLRTVLNGYDGPAQIALQPVSTDPEATALCFDACMANGWRLSVQTHKFVGAR